jgi:outer membrane protein OmpA-like peptidoglycan-associated protein
VATQSWVQEQLDPLRTQVADVNTHLSQTQATTEQTAAQIGDVKTHLDATEQKATLALKNLEHLRLEQHFVLGIKEGANFAVNSADIPVTARRAIDDFLQSLQGADDAIFLVAGHADSTGDANYNYALAQRRANNVARYLIMQKGIDPLRVSVVSYGAHRPLADNGTWQGRHKNRRVELLIYKHIITSTPGGQRLELMRTSHQ